jgi:hypothetical protein
VIGAKDTSTDDGSATFATDINPNLLVGVAPHELTHAMGRVPYGPPYSSAPDIFDLFRFTAAFHGHDCTVAWHAIAERLGNIVVHPSRY